MQSRDKNLFHKLVNNENQSSAMSYSIQGPHNLSTEFTEVALHGWIRYYFNFVPSLNQDDNSIAHSILFWLHEICFTQLHMLNKMNIYPCFLSWSPPPPPWVEVSGLWLSRWGVGGGGGPCVCVMRCVIIDLPAAHHPDINTRERQQSLTVTFNDWLMGKVRLHLNLFPHYQSVCSDNLTSQNLK